MKCQFVVGQKVTPVRSAKWYVGFDDPRASPFPVQGKAYTVSHLMQEHGTVWLGLREMPVASVYDFRGFRPLNERPAETDIGVFQRLLKTRDLEDA